MPSRDKVQGVVLLTNDQSNVYQAKKMKDFKVVFLSIACVCILFIQQTGK